MKKLSVVTISFNQKDFLKDCIESVLVQKDESIEYIVVDPGSTDGSRRVISEYARHIDKIIFEKDRGPADGLNNGFSHASGEIYYYLNSDDIVQPQAFAEATSVFEMNPGIDVLAGAGVVLSPTGVAFRRIFSDPITRYRLAYGGGILIQPATFIRKKAFIASGGFNPENRSNWDAELIVDLFLSGAQFCVVENVWGGYRLHADSITATGRTVDLIDVWNKRKRAKLGFSDSALASNLLSSFYRLERLCRTPSRIADRLLKGKVFGAASK